MSGNLYIFSILLGTVILHGTENASVKTLTFTDPISIAAGTPTDNPVSSTTAKTDLVTSTSLATESTSANMSTEVTRSSSTSGSPNPGGVTKEDGNGLTPAEAAGVAVGTIAGVAALGGGIFVGLKFSGKLG